MDMVIVGLDYGLSPIIWVWILNTVHVSLNNSVSMISDDELESW